MKKLSEREIINVMNKKRKDFLSEDVEVFRLGSEQCAVCVDTLVESTDIPRGSKLADISRKSIVSSLSDFAAKGIIILIIFTVWSATDTSFSSLKGIEDEGRFGLHNGPMCR